MDVLAPPTADDARRAAAELAAAGVSRVLLFGSVARGDATDRSDIDLVAVFDDLDYSRRWGLRIDLSYAAENAVGRHVDVHVTDRPEWARRTAAVPSSFEAGIAPDAVVLIDRPVGAVNWDKEIGLPDNNTDEALGRLKEAAKALDLMLNRLLPSEWEVLEPQDGLPILARMIDICSAGAMAVETSLKALAAVSGNRVPPAHSIHSLVPSAGAWAGAVRAALADLEHNTVSLKEEPYGDLTIWHQAGTYIADRPDIDLAAASLLALLIGKAAVETARIAVAAIAPMTPDHQFVSWANKTAQMASDTIKRCDLLTGAVIDE